MPWRVRLIDVVVGLVIVLGLLLLFPAVDIRIETRRSRCQNNFKNITLGLVQYEMVRGQFPPSVVTVDGNHFGGTSYIAAVLPYLDEQELYNSYNFTVPSWHESNAVVVSRPIKILTCPENSPDPIPAQQTTGPDGRPLPGNSVFAQSHYAVNWGGGRNGFGEDFVKKNGTGRGVMRENWGAKGAEITDGMGVTILVGEKLQGQGWAVGGWGASEFDVGPTPRYVGNDARAQQVYTGSHHLLSSFAFCDGSVRVLSGSVDPRVWYALITRNGREVLSKEDLSK